MLTILFTAMDVNCEIHKILPLNHCCYYDQVWDGKFTFHKAGKRSQIDFLFTNQQGRKYVTDFKIVDSGWHMSDHLSLTLSLNLPFDINIDTLLVRAMELSQTYQPISRLHSYRFKVDHNAAKARLLEKYSLLVDSCNDGSPDTIIETLEDYIIPTLKDNKINNYFSRKSTDKKNYKECDNLFNMYMLKLKDPHYKEDEIITSYKAYQLARNRMNASSLQFHEGIYKEILEHGNVKKLWSEINWSGRSRECKNQTIPV